MKPVAMFDLFAGGGGAAEGALMAGAIVPLAWECWFEKNKETGEYEVTPHQPALDVHAANHPETKVRQVAIGLNPEWEVTILKKWFQTYRNRGYHIHLHGSPPCQALSNASRTNADEGMVLVNHYLWLVEQTEPDSWSMENVVPVKKKLPENCPAVILNSADFGVPQTRRRCFAGEGWIAQPTHTKEEWVSVLDALPHLEDEFNVSLRMDAGRSSAPTSGVNPKTGKKEGGSGPLSRPITDPSYTIMSSPRRIRS